MFNSMFDELKEVKYFEKITDFRHCVKVRPRPGTGDP